MGHALSWMGEWVDSQRLGRRREGRGVPAEGEVRGDGGAWAISKGHQIFAWPLAPYSSLDQHGRLTI